MSEQVDRFGTVASSICAAHCAICALLPAAFSSLGLGFLMGHEAEWAFTVIAVVFALGALALGWRQHRSLRVAGLLSLGIIGLLASRGIEMTSTHHDDHGHGAEMSDAHHEHHEHGAENHTTKDENHGNGTEVHSEHHNQPNALTMEQAASGEKSGAHETEGHHAEAGESGHDSSESLHLAGAGVGVLGGILLLLGHLLNIQSTRRCRENCSE